ncbi:MAG: hypothetical protein DRJ10_11980 [Bacteroidetes bacterium]|nr:MAG: hypothetical protein DRJ10_11980 [Bacteroidota bacterium]
MKKLLSLFISLALLVSCSNNKEKEKEEILEVLENTIENKEATDLIIIPEAELRLSYLKEDDLKSLKEKLKGKYDQILFYSIYDNNYYYYVVNGLFEGFKKEEQTFTIGILDTNFNEIIPVVYDKIYNIGTIQEGTVVVEKNGLRGLYDLNGNKLIEAKYQALYPVNEQNVLAQFKKGNIFGWIDLGRNERKGKTIAPHKELGRSPLESQLIKNWEFSNKKTNLLLDAKYYPPSGNIITPSYIFDLGFLPTQLPVLNVIGSEYMDNNDASFKVKATKSFGENVLAVIVGFFETGPDARDYFVDNETKLVLLNRNMQPISNITLQNGDTDCNTYKEYYKFFGDTLIEIMQGDALDYPYHSLQGYKYFALDKTGKTTELKTNRFFKYTKFVKIDKDYFYGCYRKEIGYQEIGTSHELLKHLSIKDLDVMRNEIFAEYGYKFKSKKWQEFFAKYDWYKPVKDNVDEFLTEKDKYNIKVILETKAKMKGHENQYTKKDTIFISNAG